MLISFSVENFGSYRDEQTFSYVASSYKEQSDWVFDADVPGLSGLRYLTAAGVFGANASGKSMLVDAISCMQRIVCGSAKLMPGDRLLFDPFRLGGESSGATTYEVCFEHEGVRYDYSFSHNATTILSELLVRYERRSPQRLYSLKRSEDGTLISFDTTSRTAKLRLLEEPLKSKPNLLLLSRAAQDGVASLVPAYLWLSEMVICYSAPFDHTDFELYGPAVDGKYGEWVRDGLVSLARKADLGIVGLKSRELPPLPVDDLKEVYSEKMVEALHAMRTKSAVFVHQGEDGTVDFTSDNESVGTLSFLVAAAAALVALQDGKLLVFDEIDRSLHPNLVEALVDLFRGVESNPNHAQLLFTSHTPSVMDGMRRDQIWMTEKGADGASTLEPLSDYNVRKNERKSVGYSAGRYGGVPIVDLRAVVS